MQEYIKERSTVMLSEDNIKKMLKGVTKDPVFHSIDHLKTLSSISQILPKAGIFCILHYGVDDAYSGHWCFLQRLENDIIEFFDPYGEAPDHIITENKHYDESATPALIYSLCEKADCELIYNDFSFQKLAKDVNSCGSWVVLRALLRSLSLEQFEKLFMRKNYEFNRDELATALTLMLL